MITVKCCVGISCHIRGCAKTMKVIKALLVEHKLSEVGMVVADLCLENCIQAPNVVVDGVTYGGITPDKAESFFFEHILRR